MYYHKDMSDQTYVRKLIYAAVFGISMAFVESAVVVYLRAIYYPDGFSFPLELVIDKIIGIEIVREAATIFMLLSVAAFAGKKFWERFAYFMFCFGIWDIFYYVWLKMLIDWPLSILEWDVLFLIPLPWIGPVVAPVTLSVFMLVSSVLIIRLFHKGYNFKPTTSSGILFLIGSGLILYSFMRDTGASLHQQEPLPYLYKFFIIGMLICLVSFIISYRRVLRES